MDFSAWTPRLSHMDPFTNFQSFDTTSQYGGAIDDTQSVISGYTTSTQLKNLQPVESLDNDETHGQDHSHDKQRQDDDLDNALDDFKDSAVDLPPHACA
jgi:hypothetical protein